MKLLKLLQLPQISNVNIARVANYFKEWPLQTQKNDELLKQFHSDNGILARSVTNVEVENMKFMPRVYQFRDPVYYQSLSLLTRIEQHGVRYSQYLLTRNACQPAIHFYGDDININVIHDRDIGLSRDEPIKLESHQVAGRRKELVSFIRQNKGDVELRGKHWMTGGVGEKLNEICAYITARQRIAYGVQLHATKSLPAAFFDGHVPINQLVGNPLMDKAGQLKGILDMFYSGVEHATIFGDYKPFFVYARGHLVPYQPTAEDVAAFLQAANDILKKPEFYAILNDNSNEDSSRAKALVDSVKAIEHAGESTLDKTAWKFGLFGRALYATGKYAAERLQEQDSIPTNGN